MQNVNMFDSKPVYCEENTFVYVDAKNIQVTKDGRKRAITCFSKIPSPPWLQDQIRLGGGGGGLHWLLDPSNNPLLC